MKKCLLLLAMMLMLISTVDASHLMGGDISATLQPSGLYRVSVTVYRDTTGVTLPTRIPLSIFSTSGPGDSIVTLFSKNEAYEISNGPIPGFPYGVEQYTYVNDTVNLPAGFYKIAFQYAARNTAIVNISVPGYMTLTADGYSSPAGNSTPGFLAMPITYFGINDTTTYNPMAFDADGDSLSWAFNRPMDFYSDSPFHVSLVPGFQPLDSLDGMTLNTATGELLWRPTLTGNYIQSYKVSEYKSGVLMGAVIRDMQFVVVPMDTMDMAPGLERISPYQTDSELNYNYTSFTPGATNTFQIKGVSRSAAANLNMHSYGEPFLLSNPASFTVTGSGNNITGTFSWSPPASFDHDVLVTFRVGNGKSGKDFTLKLRKGAPAPGSVVHSKSVVGNFRVYPNPAHDHISISGDLAAGIDADIALYNVLGQNIVPLYKGPLNKGSFHIDSELQLPQGTYFILLKNKDKLSCTYTMTIQ